MTHDPTDNNYVGFENATINIDRSTNLDAGGWLMGTTLDPAVSATVKVYVAICGARYTLTAADPESILTTALTAPSDEEKVVDIASLYSFVTPSDVI